MKKTKRKLPIATRREVTDLIRAEKGWRAVYLDNESEGPRFLRVVMWGRFLRVDDETDDDCGRGVAAMVQQQIYEPDDELCFAEDCTIGQFMGLAEPDDDGSIWFDIATQQVKQQADDRAREELRDLKKLIGPECPQGWTEARNDGRIQLAVDQLGKVRREDPILVRDLLTGHEQWMIVLQTYGVMGRELEKGMLAGEVYFDVASPERYVRNSEYEMRISRRHIVAWRFPNSRMEYPG